VVFGSPDVNAFFRGPSFAYKLQKPKRIKSNCVLIFVFAPRNIEINMIVRNAIKAVQFD